jgi:hypothetical protein
VSCRATRARRAESAVRRLSAGAPPASRGLKRRLTRARRPRPKPNNHDYISFASHIKALSSLNIFAFLSPAVLLIFSFNGRGLMDWQGFTSVAFFSRPHARCVSQQPVDRALIRSFHSFWASRRCRITPVLQRECFLRSAVVAAADCPKSSGSGLRRVVRICQTVSVWNCDHHVTFSLICHLMALAHGPT